MARKYEMLIRARGNTKDAERALKKLQGELAATGGSLKTVGSGMTRFVTLPMLAVSAAAIKLSADFHESMVKIGALTGASSSQVKAWSKDILALSGKLPQGPKELADALYFVASSGFKGAAAMRVLRASAVGAAAGLGETKDVADLVTGVLNAYGEKNISASRTTDILVAAVKEGKAEAPGFAHAMGRIIPISAEMGISFDQVAGAIAAMTKKNLDVNEATTALRQIMQSIIKPSAGARKAFEEMGLPVERIRKMFRQKDGLIPGLVLMQKHMKGNQDVIGKAIPNIRALSGFLNLVGHDSKATSALMLRVRDATDAAGIAADKASKSPLFKMRQALSKLKVALIKWGDILMPTVLEITEDIGKLADKFSNLPKHTQATIVKFALLAAAIGPVIFVAGQFLVLLSNLKLATFGLLGPVGVAIGLFFAFGGSLKQLFGLISQYRAVLGGLVAGFVAYRGALLVTAMATTTLAAVSRAYAGVTALVAASQLELNAIMLANPATAFAAVIGIAAAAIVGFSLKTDDASAHTRKLRDAIRETEDALDRLTDANNRISSARLNEDIAVAALKEARAQKAAAKDAQSRARAELSIRSAKLQVRDAVVEVERAERDQGRAAKEAAKKIRKNTQDINTELDKQKQLKKDIAYQKSPYNTFGADKKELRNLNKKLQESKDKVTGLATLNENTAKKFGIKWKVPTSLISKYFGKSRQDVLKSIADSQNAANRFSALKMIQQANAVGSAWILAGGAISAASTASDTPHKKPNKPNKSTPGAIVNNPGLGTIIKESLNRPHSALLGGVHANMKSVGLVGKGMGIDYLGNVIGTPSMTDALQYAHLISQPTKEFLQGRIGQNTALLNLAIQHRGEALKPGAINGLRRKIKRGTAELNKWMKQLKLLRLKPKLTAGEKLKKKRLVNAIADRKKKLHQWNNELEKLVGWRDETADEIVRLASEIESDTESLNDLNTSTTTGGGDSGGSGTSAFAFSNLSRIGDETGYTRWADASQSGGLSVTVNQSFTGEPDMFAASQSAAWAYRAAIMRVS